MSRKLDNFAKKEEDYDKIELHTAINTYKEPTKNLEIKLAGEIHLAEGNYFQDMIDELNKTDKVLYENIGHSDIEFKDKFKPAYLFLKTLSSHYRLMEKHIGLKFKGTVLEEMFEKDEKLKDKWENVDMTIKEFLDIPKTKSENFTYVLALLTSRKSSKIYKKHPDVIKEMLILNSCHHKNYDLGRAILESRNEKVEAKIDEIFQSQKDFSFGIVYGAMHMPYFEDHIKKLGFVQKEHKWFKALEKNKPLVAEKYFK